MPQEEAQRPDEPAESAEAGANKVRKMEEEDPPERLEDWPTDAAKYQTYGGPEGQHGYDEGPEAKLGPSGLRHHPDGRVTIDGEEVEDPSQYKGDPIPGGPTDPSSVDGPAERIRKKREQQDD